MRKEKYEEVILVFALILIGTIGACSGSSFQQHTNPIAANGLLALSFSGNIFDETKCRTTIIATTMIAMLAEIFRMRRVLSEILILVRQAVESVLHDRLRSCLLPLGLRVLSQNSSCE